MAKLWMILFFYALGIISGSILWEKIDVKTIYKGQIKMKQRGRGNTQNSDVTLKMDKKAKREQQKQDNIIAKNKKKAQKAAKHLEKNS